MKKPAGADERLLARKKPTQRRSLQTVNKILDATKKLLKETGGARSARITTNHIAQEANISVGSLYQYFPNSEAVVFELYRGMLEQVRAVLDDFDSAENLSLPRQEFFNKLNQTMTSAGPENEFVIEMHHATKIYPLLASADRKHAEEIAKRIGGFLRHYGSKWPTAKLERLALYVYYMDYGTWVYREHAKPPANEARQWEVSTLNFIFDQCFD